MIEDDNKCLKTGPDFVSSQASSLVVLNYLEDNTLIFDHQIPFASPEGRMISSFAEECPFLF